jgi:hypothetical protein
MPHKTDGTSFVNLLGKPNSKWNNNSYGYFNNGISLRTKHYRLTRYFREEEPKIELYDHNKDPFENNNIANDRPEIVQRLMPVLEKGNMGIF